MIKNEVIDFERKGNLVRLYLGKNGKQWGDDWDDVPYEHNAGKVYDEFIKGYCDIVIDFDYEVEEPHLFLDLINSPYNKKDMIDKKIFALTITKIGENAGTAIHFGDKIGDILSLAFVKLVKRGSI